MGRCVAKGYFWLFLWGGGGRGLPGSDPVRDYRPNPHPGQQSGVFP